MIIYLSPSTGDIMNPQRTHCLIWEMNGKTNFSMICAIVGYTWYKSIRKLEGFDFI